MKRLSAVVILLVLVLPRVVGGQTGNLVVNPGWESGAGSWNYNGAYWTLVPNQARTGQNNVAYIGAPVGSLSQGVTVTSGTNYVAQMYVRLRDAAGAVTVAVQSSSVQGSGTLASATCSASVGAWSLCSVPWTGDRNGTVYLFGIGSYFDVDDTYFGPAAAPTPTAVPPSCEDYPIALSPAVTRLQLTGYNVDHVLYSLQGSVYIYGASGWSEIMTPAIRPAGTPLSEFGMYQAGDIIGFRGLYQGAGTEIVLRACYPAGGGGAPWADAGGGGGPWYTATPVPPTPTDQPPTPTGTPAPTPTGTPAPLPTMEAGTISQVGCTTRQIAWGGLLSLSFTFVSTEYEIIVTNVTVPTAPGAFGDLNIYHSQEQGGTRDNPIAFGDGSNLMNLAGTYAGYHYFLTSFPGGLMQDEYPYAVLRVCVNEIIVPTATVAATATIGPGTGGEGTICYRAASALRSLLENSSIPYCWGGDVPNQYRSDLIGPKCPTGSGLDCSGSFIWAYNQAGANWSDADAATLAQQFAPVVAGCSLADLSGCAIGDAFFLSDDGTAAGVYHVSMYLGGGLWGDCYNTSTGCQVWDVRGLSVYQTQLWGIGRPSVSEGWEPCSTNAPPVGNTGGPGVDFWTPIRWIWDQLRGILIPGPDDWQEVRDALLPLWDREPFGTVQDMNELIQVVRADMAAPGEDAGLLWEVTAWDTGGAGLQALSTGEFQALDGESGGGGSGWDDSGGGGSVQYTNWAHVLQGFSMWRLVASAGGWLNWMADRLPADVMTFVKAVGTMLVWFGLYRYVRQRVVVTV